MFWRVRQVQNWWVIYNFLSLNLTGLKKGRSSRVPVAPTVVMEASLNSLPCRYLILNNWFLCLLKFPIFHSLVWLLPEALLLPWESLEQSWLLPEDAPASNIYFFFKYVHRFVPNLPTEGRGTELLPLFQDSSLRARIFCCFLLELLSFSVSFFPLGFFFLFFFDLHISIYCSCNFK